MNQRLRELMLEAGYAAPELAGRAIKLSELIIQECINRIEQNRSSGENTDSWTITRDMAFHQMKRDLKEHFGSK